MRNLIPNVPLSYKWRAVGLAAAVYSLTFSLTIRSLPPGDFRVFYLLYGTALALAPFAFRLSLWCIVRCSARTSSG